MKHKRHFALGLVSLCMAMTCGGVLVVMGVQMRVLDRLDTVWGVEGHSVVGGDSNLAYCTADSVCCYAGGECLL